MKRGTPLKRKTKLQARRTTMSLAISTFASRRTPLRRVTRLRARSQTNSYRRRERDLDFMRWVKRQPCIVRELPPRMVATAAEHLATSPYRPLFVMLAATPCDGPVEADHMGARGMGQKADDRTCVPMCRNHHRERTDHMRSFRPLTKAELRVWRARAIELTQAAWSNR